MQDGQQMVLCLKGAIPACPRHWIPTHFIVMQPLISSWVCLPPFWVLSAPCSPCPISTGNQFRRPAWSLEYRNDCGLCEVSCLENRRVNTNLERDSERELLSFSYSDKLLFILFTDGIGEKHSQVNRGISSNFHFWLQDGQVTTRGSFLP